MTRVSLFVLALGVTLLLLPRPISNAAEPTTAPPEPAAPPPSETVVVLDTNHYHHIDQALAVLNCTRVDAGFTKDVVTNLLWSFQPVRDLLEDPFELDPFAGKLLAAMAHTNGPDVDAILEPLLDHGLFRLQLEPERASFDFDPPADLDPAFEELIQQISDEAVRRNLALPGPSLDDDPAIRDVLTGLVMSQLDFIPWPELEPRLRLLGLGDSETLRADRERLDPSPALERTLDQLTNLHWHVAASASASMAERLRTLQPELAAITKWPAQPVEFAPGIWIGSPNDDTYTNAFHILLEPGGNDTYTGHAAAATPSNPISILLELGGDDLYKSDAVLGAGSALLGSCILIDFAGDDHYHAALLGQGSAINGVAWHEDLAGDDSYRAAACSQGAAVNGFAVLHDRAGTDSYRVGQTGQGYANVRAIGILVDRTGDDAYHAGGLTKVPWYPGQTFSMSQGFAIGERPLTGGGIGALVDLDGSDNYKADVYGQGVSYWYSLGMLYDRRGNDTYHMFHYGQGTGIHLSTGLLLDGDGKDSYTATEGLAQGSAHDYAVGWLVDQGSGRDQYSADHFAQGRGMNNSFAMLLDSGGVDSYYARILSRAQGIGDNGRFREYGSLSLLLDLGGVDNYALDGFENGQQLRRPDHGVVYDYEAPKEVEK